VRLGAIPGTRMKSGIRAPISKLVYLTSRIVGVGWRATL
jgi:hypothetical protein